MRKLTGALAAALIFWCRIATAGPSTVVVELEQDAPEIDGTELRDAVARELQAPVVSEEGPGVATIRIVVRIDHARREIEVDREGPTGQALVRRVPLPATPVETLRTAVFLIGNLARDEASALLHDLQPPAAPAPAAPAPEANVQAPVAASAPASETRRDLWIGVSLEGDLAEMPGANDVCLMGPLYQCVDGQAAWPSNATVRAEIDRGVEDQVGGGLRPANARFLIAVDGAISDHVLLGGRLGIATATYPVEGAKAFGRLHLEARATYVLGGHPLATTGLFPVFALGAGLAEHSASVPVMVDLTQSMASQLRGTETAWNVAGPGFVSAGAGLRWTVSQGFALTVLPLKATVAFGTGEPMSLLSPEITAQFGF